MKEKLIKLLTKHEGCRLMPYKDIKGLWTIGVGRCLDTKGLSKTECDHLELSLNDYIEQLHVTGITRAQSDYLLSNDIDYFTDELYKRVSWVKSAPETVKIILTDMAFNLGVNGLLKFKTTLGLIKHGNYKEASRQMLNSLWAKQVKGRAIELSNMLSSC